MPKKCKDLAERFWEKVYPEPNTGCLLWSGAASSTRYGHMWVEGRVRYATHVSWRLHTGQWPAQHMLHRCDTPACVNPDHLFEGSQQENIADCVRKGRKNSPRGERHYASKLKDSQVAEIRRRAREGERGVDLAREFGIAKQTVSNFRHGRSRRQELT